MTELTCWKCGEDSLQEAAGDEAAKHGSYGEQAAATGVKHSVCQKCGTYAVSPAQSRHNKIARRKTRKERIRDANRTST